MRRDAAALSAYASECVRSTLPRRIGDRSAWRSRSILLASASLLICGIHIEPCYLQVRAAARAMHPAGRGGAHSGESHGLQESAPPRAAGLNRELVEPTPPARDACEASELFCDDLLQDVPIEAEIGDQPLQLVVLFAQLTQLPQLVQTEPRILLLPEIKALLTDAVLAAYLDYSGTCFGFPQYAQNLLFRVSSLAHPDLLLVSPRQSRRPRSLNFRTA